MPSLKFIRNLLACIFTLKPPQIELLEYIDIIIDQKANFLIGWKFSRGISISIRELNFNSSETDGSASIVVPEGVQSVTIIIRNCWKKVTQVVHLKRLELDNYLDFHAQLKDPLTIPGKLSHVVFELKRHQIEMNNKRVGIKSINLAITPRTFFLKDFKHKVNSKKLHYEKRFL